MPHGVVLTGFDDTFAASVVTPQLSTVSQRQYALGRATTKMVRQRL
jgi:DNA-binding LacI/PurR family transcriptional regulator